ncbi:ABC transporter ATP-binding protein [Paenibacillus rubinfantis]|uniref:ABC transporter ATP-binding protein n=1 Tax=Paenibacillus rubinfantis TaxID=1720296 RepID=UPI00073E4A35|nr:ABC transporter ATP-binding protein [Paenibacillus rubinfantis]
MLHLIKKRNFVLVCILLVISAAINVYFAFVLQQIIDSTLTHDVSVLLQSIGFAVLFMLFDMSVTIVSKYAAGHYIRDVLEVMKTKKFYLSLSSFNTIKVGSDDRVNVADFSTNMDIIENDFLRSRLNIVFYTAQFIFGLVAMLSISYMVTLGISVVTLIPIFLPKLLKNQVRHRKEHYSEQSGNYLKFVNESLQGKLEIRDYNKKSVFVQKHDLVNHQVEEARFKSRFIDSAVAVMAQNFGFLTFITALGIGSYYVIRGEMTFGYMMALVQLMNNLLQPLNYIISSLNQINSSKNIANDYTEAVSSATLGDKLITNFHKHIVVTNLSFAYEENKFVFDDLNLCFEKGKKYAVIGPSGCGKSTFAKILAGDIRNYFGRIEIDGQELKVINEHDYRSLIRYVRQDCFIFTDSIRNNILFYDNCFDDRQLKQAIKLAGASSFATTDEQVSQHVSNTIGLSGGQKQRVSLARALIRTPEILILDEVTSSVDPQTTFEIYRNLVTLYEGTCIVITHQQDEKILHLFDEIIDFSELLPSSEKKGVML